MAVLSLIRSVRASLASPGQLDRARYVPWLREPLHQIEFVIDGVPLRHLLETVEVPEAETSGFQDGLDLLSVADQAWPDEAAASLRRLAGVQEPSADWPLQPGRLPLYVCPMCADLACGAITVDVAWDEAGGTVTWRDLRLEDGHSESAQLLDLGAMPEYVFDAAPYRDTLLDPVGVLDALDAEERVAKEHWRRRRGVRSLARRAMGHGR